MTIQESAPAGQPEQQEQQPQGGQQPEAPGGQQQEKPPWEREGEEFSPERAWNTITKLRELTEKQARQVGGLEKKVETERQKSLSPDEKVLSEAEQRGRTAAAQEFGARLARERFDSLAGRRNSTFNTADALEYVDLTKFVGEDGNLDEKAIAKAVERLVPEAQPENQPPSFDGGVRTPPSPGTNFSDTIRKRAGH